MFLFFNRGPAAKRSYFAPICNLQSEILLQLKQSFSIGVGFRNRRSQMFFKISVLKILQYSHENTCVKVCF